MNEPLTIHYCPVCTNRGLTVKMQVKTHVLTRGKYLKCPVCKYKSDMPVVKIKALAGEADTR